MLSMTLSTDERITNAHTVPSWPTSMFGSHRRDRSAITRRALSLQYRLRRACNLVRLARVSGFMSSTTILVSPGRPAEIGMASRR